MSLQIPEPDLGLLGRRHFDLLVIGGGIHGCAIARDAARRGLRTCLLEKDDFASGTSSASSKLIHGGLRYLENLQFGLVRESLRERATMLHLAPHLVRPLPFLIPIYEGEGRSRLLLRCGLTLYDLLAGREGLGRHRWLSREATLAAEPRLRAEGLKGAFRYMDAQMDDARLCLENALDARAFGAEVWNDFRVEGLIQTRGRVVGVQARDGRSGELVEIRAQQIVNAAGPWLPEVGGMQELGAPTPIRKSRGVHLVVPRISEGHALLLQARRDGRVFFIMPWRGQSLIGTTDVETDIHPDLLEPTRSEVDYLLEESSHALAGEPLVYGDIQAQLVGMRALIGRQASTVGKVSRELGLHEDAPGFLAVTGGKFTTSRQSAEEVVDFALRRIDRQGLRECDTARAPLPGGDVPPMDEYFDIAQEAILSRYPIEAVDLRALLGRYGARHPQILQLIADRPALAQRLEPDFPFLAAEVIHARREEWARNLDDILWRRSWRAHVGELSPSARTAWETAFELA